MTEPTSVRETITDSIKYWEPRRLIYNGALALVVIAHFLAELPESKNNLSINLLLGVFLLAVLANVAYCAAYLVDIFAQASGWREVWLQFRWFLLLLGTTFAAIITHFVSSGMFLIHTTDIG